MFSLRYRRQINTVVFVIPLIENLSRLPFLSKRLFCFLWLIPRSNREAIVSEADVKELWVLAQLIVTYHVKHLNATSRRGTDKKPVTFGREFNTLALGFGIKGVEQAGWC